ncbi:constitutive coactivator of PPAR-gamma-like protein 1 homolog isoform X2 [Rhodnius prolixus]|uniref:constitutive coactivator of PPAR-gamma-like protein 1 homolog isoform X2 n=1 Tax=Rhodnius prolixus TaxID=13249 RepID=UPI003D18D4DD
MGVQDLQTFLEGGHVEGSSVSVDLVRIARNQAQKWVKQGHKKPQNGTGKFSIVVDAECCLDRLYGGYFSDWVCGGQWSRVNTFLSQFVASLSLSNIELAVFFNGCNEPARTREWIAFQLQRREKISNVLRHLANKGTPPPKVWWIAPSCLKPALRMALRNLNVPVFVTMDDHRQEVIAYCRENSCHAIVADDAEYIAFNPPRYFSARHLKLTYKGTLESNEYIIGELMKGLNLTPEQLCVVAALLGNFLLPESELMDLYQKLKLDHLLHTQKDLHGLTVMSNTNVSNAANNSNRSNERDINAVVRSVADFVRSLQSVELDDLGTEIFGAVGGERAAKFKKAVQYYRDGTKNGFLRFRTTGTSFSGKKNTKKVGKNGEKNDGQECLENSVAARPFASEAQGSELDGLISVSEAVACLSVGPEIVVDETMKQQPEQAGHVNGASTNTPEVNGGLSLLATASNSSSSSGATSPARAIDVTANTNVTSAKKKSVRLMVEEEKIVLPPVASEIMRTVSERHTKGLMSPIIYQILTTGEVKLPVVMEDETHKDVPSIQLFFRPLRKMLYAILFNLHHQTYMAKMGNKGSDIKIPEIKIKEWIWSKGNQYEKPDIVKAEPLGWGVPTIQRLWFGTTVDDKRRRLRAYLTCMRSDTQLMLNPGCVPQHLLVLATVLRYMMSFPERKVLRKHELDAIIVTALDPHLGNSEYNQDLQVECVSSRGAQLGAMIMTGIEYALTVNDACGAPIPWLMTCPYLFFDGKLLHSNLAKSASVKNLLELCSHRIPHVMKVERMREAILDGLYVQWARPPLLPPLTHSDTSRVHAVMPAGMTPRSVPLRGGSVPATIRGRDNYVSPQSHQFLDVQYNFAMFCESLKDIIIGEGFKHVCVESLLPAACMTTGGRLEIAGVVVGNWGPNCRLHQNLVVQPQVTSVGGLSSYGTGASGGGGAMMRSGGKGASFSTRGVNSQRGKGRGIKNQGRKKSGGNMAKKENKKQSRGRGMTVLSPLTGEVMNANDLLHDSMICTGNEEKKRILTNADSAKQLPLHRPTHLMVNGSENIKQKEQFEETTTVTNTVADVVVGVNGSVEVPAGSLIHQN